MEQKQFETVLSLLADVLALSQLAYWDQNIDCGSDFDSIYCEPCHNFRFCHLQKKVTDSLRQTGALPVGG